jgi:hypothetical protein
MVDQILIALKRNDRVEEIIPFIQQIARPGMKLLCLVHCGVSGLNALMDQLLAIRTGIRLEVLAGSNSKGDVLKERRQWAEQRVLPACDVLRNRGVKIEVIAYAGRLQRVVQNYLQKEDIRLVMMPSRGDWVTKYLYRIGPMARLLNSGRLRPVVFLLPGK